MEAYRARHISRMTEVKGVTADGLDMVGQIQYDPSYTRPRVFKMQLFVDQECQITINGHSTITVFPTHSFTIDYTDMIVESLVFKADGVQYHAIIGY